LDNIENGESYELCITNKVKTDFVPKDPLQFYLALRRKNPAPFAAYFNFIEFKLASSSPE